MVSFGLLRHFCITVLLYFIVICILWQINVKVLKKKEAESTLKIWFCTDRGARAKKIRRFARALRKRTKNGRAEIGTNILYF